VPADRRLPEKLVTLGDHLRQRRIERGLVQREVADELGASEASLVNWEAGHREPALRFIPRIIHFLGYDPRGEGRSLGERLRLLRQGLGLSGKETARAIGLDPGTLRRLEREGHARSEEVRVRVEEWLGRCR